MIDESMWSNWGNVPEDGDVLPFTRIPVHRSAESRNNKRHHFISVTYMNGFTDNGRVWAYRSEDPGAPLHVTPSAIGFEKFYYSQKLPDGSQENHRFEDLWNAIETVWPRTVSAVAERRLSSAISFNVLGMATIMRARVPAARERNEVLYAAKLRAEVQALERIGALPEELQRYAGELDTVPVGINPQETLIAMRAEFKEFGDLCFKLGFEIIHNRSNLAFITSDNPVCIYDPTDRFDARRPYEFEHDIELIFPIDSRTVLRGCSRLRPVNQIVRHRTLLNRDEVRRRNRTIAQFAYRLLITPDRSSDHLALRYAAVVPTVEVELRSGLKESQIVWRHAFGPRPRPSPYIDTPEKATRLEAQLTAQRTRSRGVS